MVIQPMTPDASFFSAALQQRLAELMAHWYADAGINTLAELPDLIDELNEILRERQ